jgi:hypothetical protein
LRTNSTESVNWMTSPNDQDNSSQGRIDLNKS